MSVIAALLDSDFEDVEFVEPARAFADAGHRVVVVGLRKGAIVKGKRGEAAVTVDRAIDDVSIREFDALFIAGGYSPDRLRARDSVVLFVKGFSDSGKPLLVICHGPQLLITARALRGRRITGWPSIAEDIRNAGAEYVDSEVVEDGSIISSRGPKDLPAFIRVSLEKLSHTTSA